ncbi:tRNA (adenosine(37)-N6)-threonylcarbamoyltransferase complex ATPase subunit type 1 TsaE [Candidatus Saccharibacteria bacterium oral taxon 488]|nr:tRNA (adenosine(37)-N6)-threonylcarbamoyltransferase complex ATPase subunit type 1 TsaE [Candidatus Saccharibacteria bacterium oral taxon 488]
MNQIITSTAAMQRLGQVIGRNLKGGEVIELVGDIGAGKTTLTKGVAKGLDIIEPVQSPTFTISRVYQSPGDLTLAHYDFYRLGEAGIMAEEIREVTMQPQTVTVVEWAGAVEQVLPADRLTARILAIDEQSRRVTLSAGGPTSQTLLAAISAADEELG